MLSIPTPSVVAKEDKVLNYLKDSGIYIEIDGEPIFPENCRRFKMNSEINNLLYYGIGIEIYLSEIENKTNEKVLLCRFSISYSKNINESDLYYIKIPEAIKYESMAIRFLPKYLKKRMTCPRLAYIPVDLESSIAYKVVEDGCRSPSYSQSEYLSYYLKPVSKETYDCESIYGFNTIKEVGNSIFMLIDDEEAFSSQPFIKCPYNPEKYKRLEAQGKKRLWRGYGCSRYFPGYDVYEHQGECKVEIYPDKINVGFRVKKVKAVK
ncbi:MAG: hypothetical protein ACP5QK_05785 [Myxococcota bacterium]